MQISSSLPTPRAGVPQDLDSALAGIQQLETDGFPMATFGNHLDADAMTIAALAGRVTSTIELVTGVVPTYPRHPMVMAQQALTTNLACGGRFILGIGLSHKFIVEDWQGMDWAPPLQHTRDYLTLLNKYFDGEPIHHDGPAYQVHMNDAPFNTLAVPGASKPGLLVAALGPGMLRLAGELADGTTMFHTGPEYLESEAIPIITKAAAAAGKPPPTIHIGLPIVVTDKVDSAIDSCARLWEVYGRIYSYRQVIKRSGANSPQDLAIVGDENEVLRQLQHLQAIGVTGYGGAILPVPEDAQAEQRTYDFLKEANANGI